MTTETTQPSSKPKRYPLRHPHVLPDSTYAATPGFAARNQQLASELTRRLEGMTLVCTSRRNGTYDIYLKDGVRPFGTAQFIGSDTVVSIRLPLGYIGMSQEESRLNPKRGITLEDRTRAVFNACEKRLHDFQQAFDASEGSDVSVAYALSEWYDAERADRLLSKAYRLWRRLENVGAKRPLAKVDAEDIELSNRLTHKDGSSASLVHAARILESGMPIGCLWRSGDVYEIHWWYGYFTVPASTPLDRIDACLVTERERLEALRKGLRTSFKKKTFEASPSEIQALMDVYTAYETSIFFEELYTSGNTELEKRLTLPTLTAHIHERTCVTRAHFTDLPFIENRYDMADARLEAYHPTHCVQWFRFESLTQTDTACRIEANGDVTLNGVVFARLMHDGEMTRYDSVVGELDIDARKPDMARILLALDYRLLRLREHLELYAADHGMGASACVEADYAARVARYDTYIERLTRALRDARLA